MQFVIIGDDKNNALELRQQTRAAHLTYWGAMGALFLAAGPFLDEKDQPVGSMIIVEAENLAGATKLAHGDPYQLAGVFGSLSIRRWNWIFGNPQMD